MWGHMLLDVLWKFLLGSDQQTEDTGWKVTGGLLHAAQMLQSVNVAD